MAVEKVQQKCPIKIQLPLHFNAHKNIDYIETWSIAISWSEAVCQRQYTIFLLKEYQKEICHLKFI